MIDTSDKLAPLVGRLLPHRKPEPVEQPVLVRDPAEQSRARSALPEMVDAKSSASLDIELRADDVGADLSGLGVRQRQAVEAYSSLQNASRREYVRQVMGIDEFV